jgi:hypothetical protein
MVSAVMKKNSIDYSKNKGSCAGIFEGYSGGESKTKAKGPHERPFCFSKLYLILICFFRLACVRRRLRSWYWSPVIEIMGYLMAVSAFRELRLDSCRVHISMTILAFRHCFMLVLMAVSAAKRVVTRLRRAQVFIRLLMAGGAVVGCDIGLVGHILRHMRSVAFVAVSRLDLGRMRFVALRACRFFAMHIVARAAALRRVFALILAQLLDLAGMTGNARVRQIRPERDVQGCVGVLMAFQAALYFEMRLALVTVIAFGDIIFRFRTVPGMAIPAADCLMASSACIYLCRLSAVTFNAVGRAEVL